MQLASKAISTVGIVCVCFGILISSIVARQLYTNETDAIAERFAHDINMHAFAIQKQVAQDIAILHSLRGMFEATREITREEFKVVSEVLIRRHPSLQAVGWVPVVTTANRAVYEETARNDNLPDFKITERQEQGSMIRAGHREAYYPVYYIEPYVGNEAALGFDLGSDPTRLEALLNARDSGEAQPTRRIQLVQESGSSWAELFFVPLYQGKPRNPTERRSSLRGYISGVFRIADIMLTSGVLQTANPKVYLELIDIHSDGEDLLFETEAEGLNLLTAAQYSLVMNLSTERHWMFRATPSSEYFKEMRTKTPALGFLFGMLITGWLAHYLTRQQEENVRVANEVKEQTEELRIRTEDLVTANVQLTREIAEREKLQQEFATLTDHEQRRLGQELHDSLGQQVAMASMMAHNLQDSMEGTEAYTKKQLGLLTGSIETAQAQIRALSKGLLPVDIGESGLKTALETLAVSIRNLNEYEVELSCDEEGFLLDNQTSTQLYRIAQEAVRNALEHADVHTLYISLHHTDCGLVLSIKDDGQGFDMSKNKSPGSGLRIMRHRAELIGADFRMESKPGHGTTILCEYGIAK